MKKVLLIGMSLIMAMSMIFITGCGDNSGSADKEKTEVTVLAAASLTDALDEIIAEYEKSADVKVTPSYAGSGDLVQQIEGGAPCDIFISASKSNMDQLEDEDLINKDTREDLLTNTLTFISTKEKEKDISLDTLTSDAVKSIAIGEPETVPAGKYATQVFENMGIMGDLEASDKIILSKDVRAVLNYVTTGDADCGFVYRTDAVLEKDNIAIIGDVDESLHDPIVYPAAVMKEAPAVDEVNDFFEFLKSDYAKDVFKKYGFTVK